MREFGGNLELTDGWTQNVSKNMDCVKSKGSSGKIELCTKFLEEEKFSFQRVISKFVSDHDIPLNLVPDLNRTPLFYVSPGK